MKPLLLVFFLAAVPIVLAQSDPGITIVHDVQIGTGGGRPLLAELAYPAKPSQTPMPAVIFIHGGGWAQGSQKPNEAQFLAPQGFFTASVEYRLSKEAQWPAQLEDSRLAVRWLRANAAKYNVDPNKIAVMGRSAGGHLAVCLGAMSALKQFDGNGGYEGISAKVQAVVDICGPTDFTKGPTGADKASWSPSRAKNLGLDALFGGSFVEKPDLWTEASPLYSVKPDAPPFLIIHGDQDATVPYEQSERLYSALQNAGVSVQMITVKGGGHNLLGPKDGPPAVPDTATIQADIAAFLNQTLNAPAPTVIQ